MSATWALAADGATVSVRELGAADRDDLRALHAGLTPDDRYLRFFTLCRVNADRYVDSLAAADGVDRPTFGAFHDGSLRAAAGYAAAPGADTAEFALVVDHVDQAHGLGTLLLESLVSTARSRGLTALTAEVLAANHRMLRALADLGLPLHCERDDDVLHVTIPLADSTRYTAAVDTRDRAADLLTLDPLLNPRSVVVVGAGRSPYSVGHAVLRNLLHGGFTGDLTAVNPHAREVLGVACHPRVADLAAVPDLAVVCVPAAAVVPVVRDCAEHGVRAVVVISSGLAGAAGDLREVVRTHGMRMVGPNCIGVVNTDPAVRLDATFLDRVPVAGEVGVVTQSGGVAIALAHELGRVGCGLSDLVSLGDKFDVSANDLLHRWTADEGTRAVVAYLESFGNPRKFARLGSALARRKPLVVIRAGVSEAGGRAAGSHTAALTSPPVAVAALYRHTGATVVDGLAEAVAAVALLTAQPLPAGPRVAVVSNAGGIGVLAADSCARHGLTVAELGPRTRADLAALLPAGSATADPVDTTAVVGDEVFARAVGRVAADDGVDAVVALTVPTALGDPAGGLGPAARAAAERGVPLLFVRPGQAVAVTRETSGGVVVPVYADVETAVRALAHAVERRAWLDRPALTAILPALDAQVVRSTAERAAEQGSGEGWLDPEQSLDLVGSTGIPVIAGRVVAVGSAVAEITRVVADHGPVAVKAVTGGLLHKAAEGGVRLGVEGEGGARAAVAALVGRFGDRLRGVFVQPMARPGTEWLVGVRRDTRFGPLVVCGPGGGTTEAEAGHRVRLCPLTEADVAELVAGADRPADLAEVVRRVARLAELVPALAELDINPVVVGGSGVVAVDARVRLVPADVVDPLLRSLPG